MELRQISKHLKLPIDTQYEILWSDGKRVCVKPINLPITIKVNISEQKYRRWFTGVDLKSRKYQLEVSGDNNLEISNINKLRELDIDYIPVLNKEDVNIVSQPLFKGLILYTEEDLTHSSSKKANKLKHSIKKSKHVSESYHESLIYSLVGCGRFSEQGIKLATKSLYDLIGVMYRKFPKTKEFKSEGDVKLFAIENVCFEMTDAMILDLGFIDLR